MCTRSKKQVHFLELVVGVHDPHANLIRHRNRSKPSQSLEGNSAPVTPSAGTMQAPQDVLLGGRQFPPGHDVSLVSRCPRATTFARTNHPDLQQPRKRSLGQATSICEIGKNFYMVHGRPTAYPAGLVGKSGADTDVSRTRRQFLFLL